jgi:hypothetical protein
MRAPLSKHEPLLPGMVVWRLVKAVSCFPLEERHVKPPPKSLVIWVRMPTLYALRMCEDTRGGLKTLEGLLVDNPQMV